MKKESSSDIAVVKNDISYIKAGLEEIKELINQQNKDFEMKYVTKEEFWPIKTIVYSGAGIILVGVFSFLVSLAIKK